jgi:hypothetical protein
MNTQTQRAMIRAANPLVPRMGDKSKIEGLEAQVDDLKYTLNNLLQCFVSMLDVNGEGRHAAVVRDARAALETEAADYLG